MDNFFLHFVSVLFLFSVSPLRSLCLSVCAAGTRPRACLASLCALLSDVTVPARPRASWPSVSGPRCSSSCWCSWLLQPRLPQRRRTRTRPPAWPEADRRVALETSYRAHAPPGVSAGGAARAQRRCPAAAAPAPERRRAACCNDYPTGQDAHGCGEEGEKGGEHALTLLWAASRALSLLLWGPVKSCKHIFIMH